MRPQPVWPQHEEMYGFLIKMINLLLLVLVGARCTTKGVMDRFAWHPILCRLLEILSNWCTKMYAEGLCDLHT